MDTSSLVNLYDRLDSQKDQTKNTSSYNFGDREPEQPSQSDDIKINDNLPATTDSQPVNSIIQSKMFHNKHLFHDDDEDLPLALRMPRTTSPVKISLSDDLVDRMRSLGQQQEDPMSRQYIYNFDDQWRSKLNKQCDHLKDKFCRHILVDLYCKIIPLDHDYVCKHQHRMASDIDDFLANRKMSSYQYLTAAKENTKAPLIDFILREADRVAKEYYEACYKEMNDNCKKGCKVPLKDEEFNNKKRMKQLAENVISDPEMQLATQLLAEKVKKNITKNVEQIVENSKDPEEKVKGLVKQDSIDNENTYGKKENEPVPKESLKKQAEETPEEQGKKKKVVKETAEEKEKLAEEKAENFKKQIEENTKKQLVDEYTNYIKEARTKSQLEFDVDPNKETNPNGIKLHRQIQADELQKESVISLCLDYASKELITENVEMTPYLNEQLIGIAIRESTLLEFDRLFSFTKDVTKNLQSTLFLNKSPLMNKNTIKLLIQ